MTSNTTWVTLLLNKSISSWLGSIYLIYCSLIVCSLKYIGYRFPFVQTIYWLVLVLLLVREGLRWTKGERQKHSLRKKVLIDKKVCTAFSMIGARSLAVYTEPKHTIIKWIDFIEAACTTNVIVLLDCAQNKCSFYDNAEHISIWSFVTYSRRQFKLIVVNGSAGIK